MIKIAATVSLLVFWMATVAAQQLSVTGVATLPIAAGEAQSTVVPPGKKSQCLQGRFLVTNDGVRPPGGVVSGRDLDNPGGPVVGSNFDLGGLSANFSNEFTKSRYFFGTNDHDLVTLSNGDVLYITGAFSRMGPSVTGLNLIPLGNGEVTTHKYPGWFPDTFRDLCTKYDAAGACSETYPFGPGARSVVLVFRSTDCGENFKYVSQMDPLKVEDGSCALPQWRRYANGSIIKSTPYDMGGTDGQLVKVDPNNDRIYLTFQCVGFEPDNSPPPGFKPPPLNQVDPNAPITFPFKLSQKPLNKTLVLASYNQGSSWQSLGFINQAAWRFSIVPEGDDLGLGYGSSVLSGSKNFAGRYDFDSTGIAAPNGSWSWFTNNELKSNPNIPLDKVYVNVWAQPLLTRAPNAKGLVLAFPDVVSQNSGHGYRVFFYDNAQKKLVEANPILPATPSPDNVAFHLVAVDPGKGPVMLYWYDLDSATKTIAIRGRIITGAGQYTNDFNVAQSMGVAAPFSLSPTKYWFGDYQTAGGFVSESAQAQGQGQFKLMLQKSTHYNFFPMWVEPDGTVRYTSVVYTTSSGLLGMLASGNNTNSKQTTQLKITTIPPEQWKLQPAAVTLSQIRRPAVESEVTSEPDTRRPLLSLPGRIVPRVRE